MVHCILCGTGNEPGYRYCAGYGCGADLEGRREGDPALAVQVAAAPDEVLARPGDTVEIRLTVRNAGSEPDKYVLELRREIGDRVTVERHGAPGETSPGGDSVWTVRYAVPWDWDPSGALTGVGGWFGDPGADGAGTAADARADDEIELPLRVVSTRDRRIAAAAWVVVRPPGAADPVPTRGSRAAAAAAQRSRRTRMMAAGAVAAVAVVAALIVGMAAAGSGGGGKRNPTRAVAATSTAPSSTASDTVSATPADGALPTDVATTEAAPSTSASRTRTATATRTRTTAPATTAPTTPRTTAPGTTAPPSSQAPTLVTVPGVIGDGYAAAAGEIDGAGLRASAQVADAKSPCARNFNAPGCVVVAQSPDAGAQVPARTRVALTIGYQPPSTPAGVGVAVQVSAEG